MCVILLQELEETPEEKEQSAFGNLQRDEIPRVVFLQDNTDDEEASSAYENSRQEAENDEEQIQLMNDLLAMQGTMTTETNAANSSIQEQQSTAEPINPTSESIHASSVTENGN